MNCSKLASTIRTAFAARISVMIYGPAGVGKSSVVAQVAEAEKLTVIDKRASQMDPTDTLGIPSNDGNGRTKWLRPSWLPESGAGIIFLDELPNAPVTVQSALYQLVLDRRLGDYVLPEAWHVVAAGNRACDRAAVTELSGPLRSRFWQVELAADLDEVRTFGLGKGWRIEVLAFLAFRPELLQSFDPKTNPRAFPNPRSWEFVSRVLWALDPTGAGVTADALLTEQLAGLVGDGAGAELSAFLQVWSELPDPGQILLDPAGAPVPTKPAARWAICGALAAVTTSQNFRQVALYGDRLPAEFAAVLVRDVIARRPDVRQTREYVSWVNSHQNILK